MAGTDLVPRTTADVIEEPTLTDGATTDAGNARVPTTRGSGRLNRATKIMFSAVALVTVLEVLAFSGTYFLYSSHYVSTDNAQVDGDQIDINAPTTGSVTGWSIGQGSTLRKNEVVGSIKGIGSGAQPQRPVKSPGIGTVAVNTVVDGQYVTSGTTLAVAYDPNSIYITARVNEKDVSGVRLGQLANISVDAYPGTPVLGTVVEIQAGTAGQFAEWPGTDTDPTNPQRVDQYVPVKISITNSNGVRLLPGMSVVAHIDR
jgi:multidrug resistance efflux pump